MTFTADLNHTITTCSNHDTINPSTVYPLHHPNLISDPPRLARDSDLQRMGTIIDPHVKIVGARIFGSETGSGI
jgi:hypothetical protein